MAEKAIGNVIDCLNALVGKQGIEGLRSFTDDPEKMMAEIAAAKTLVHEYAFGTEEESAGGNAKIERGVLVLPGRRLVWNYAIHREKAEKGDGRRK